MKDFKDKVVVITGSATGIGFSFAKAFGAEGAKVVLSGRRDDRLQDAANSLSDLDVDVRYHRCDVAQKREVEALADFAWDAFGRVDVIVNNAGIILPQHPAIDTPDDDVQRIFAVNFYGVWHGSAVFGKRFVEQGTPAAIYNVGSENSFFSAAPFAAPYVATKHAVLALTDALREETPDFIDIGLICPGLVRSEIASQEVMALGMDTDRFTAVAMEQMKKGAFFIVSHAYNIARIDARHDEVAEAYAQHAPRYEGDDEFDVRTLSAKLGEHS